MEKVLGIEAFTNANWVSNIGGKRSTNGLAMFFGSTLVQQGFKKQKVIALSSTKVDQRAIS